MEAIMEEKDAVTLLMDKIEKTLKRNKKTVADLAREIGRDYHQVYFWVKVRRFKPRGDATLMLKQWLDRHE